MSDFVIVGAGSAGCVLANRLSAGGATVTVLEAGGADDNPLIRIPAMYAALQDTDLDWAYRTTPQTNLNRRRIFSPRGRVLGGSSSINYMVYMRGNRGDYDHWRQLGAEGWSYDDVLPYFRKAENNARIHDQYHGVDGPLSVTDASSHHPLTKLFFDAAASIGLPYNDDFNGARQDGYGPFQMTVGAGGRCSAATAYLHPAMDRKNLTVIPRAHALSVAIDHGRATGVQYLHDGEVRFAPAASDVILSGGAFNSPQLLMLSGVGDETHLRAVGVDLLHHLPGVGCDLQDHLSVRVRCEIDQPLTLFGMTPDATLAAQRAFLERGEGPFATNYIEAGCFVSCDDNSEYPDTQCFFAPNFGGEFDGAAIDRHGFLLAAYANRPQSRGVVRLASKNPFDRPVIDPCYLSAPRDRDLAMRSVAMMRKIASAPAFASVGAREIHPGPAIANDDDLAAYVRSTASTTWHPTSSCRMGVDDMAVVDPALNVRGIDRLRVVDASVMPTMVSGNTNAPTIMIAEKAADMILADAA